MTMQNPLSPPASDAAEEQQANAPRETNHSASRPAGPYVGRPLDGSQYIDVIEEQEYADRRPTPEEQRPRFSYAVKQNKDASTS